ncbi:hypothetical protein B0A55_11056, partial [Friedmanniomyces simplex]
MGKKRALCCISVDIDAVAGWLGSYGGEDKRPSETPANPGHPPLRGTSDISRGLFAGTIGVRRLLKMFD